MRTTFPGEVKRFFEDAHGNTVYEGDVCSTLDGVTKGTVKRFVTIDERNDSTVTLKIAKTLKEGVEESVISSKAIVLLERAEAPKLRVV